MASIPYREVIADQAAWTATGGSVAFPALDGNGNGAIDSGAALPGDARRLRTGAPVENDSKGDSSRYRGS
jgi:hypothetical protein